MRWLKSLKSIKIFAMFVLVSTYIALVFLTAHIQRKMSLQVELPSPIEKPHQQQQHQQIAKAMKKRSSIDLSMKQITEKPVETTKMNNPDSLSILMNAVLNTSRPIWDERVDPLIEAKRCEKYGWGWDFSMKNNTTAFKRRRIFAGSLIADDTWHVIGASALESYGIFHAVVFVESNRTQQFTVRSLRFQPDQEEYKMVVESGIFGPNTTVVIDQYIDEVQEDSESPMVREAMQREIITKRWKALGMQSDDIGLVMDVDEIPSRDFLRAAQICDVPSWTMQNQTCRNPMVRFITPFFEGSPKCVHKGKKDTLFRRWSRMAMIIGKCIEDVGDSTLHPKAPRVYVDGNGDHHGNRLKGYGGHNWDYHKMPNGVNGLYPLYTAQDFRFMHGTLVWGNTGFHFHNFFDSTDALRFKYATYGHTHKGAYTDPLGSLNSDLNLIVNCVMNRKPYTTKWLWEHIPNGLEQFASSFPLPLAFQLQGYVDARHEELKAMIEYDEKIYGRPRA